jgi:hypothetical protein
MKSANLFVAVVAVLGGLACVGGPGPLPDSLGEQGQGGSGSDGSEESTIEPGTEFVESCAPGEVSTCPCEGGTAGARQCREDGRSFSDCICPDLDGG